MIVRIDPEDWQHSNVVQIDSDADDDRSAIDDLEQWAAEHDFVRTTEFCLRELVSGGRHLFRGICYRISDEEHKTNLERARRISEAVDRMPVTRHQVAG